MAFFFFPALSGFSMWIEKEYMYRYRNFFAGLAATGAYLLDSRSCCLVYDGGARPRYLRLLLYRSPSRDKKEAQRIN